MFLRFIFLYFLIVSISFAEFSDDIVIKNTYLGKYENRNYFCIELLINNIPENISKGLDILVKDSARKTHSHFLLSPQEYFSYTNKDSLLEFDNTKNIFRWYGLFEGHGATYCAAKLVSLFDDAWEKDFSTVLNFPQDIAVDKDIFQKWGISRNSLYRLYMENGLSNSFIDYGLLSSCNKFNIPVKVPQHLLFENTDSFFSTTFLEKNKFANILIYPKKEFDIPISELSTKISPKNPNVSKVQTFPVTQIIPEEYYFLHITSPNSIFNLVEKIQKCQDNALSLLENNGRSSSLMLKLLETLGIFMDKKEEGEDSGFGRDLMGWVIGDIAFVGSDFLYQDGTSYGIVVNVKSTFLLNMQLNKYFHDAKSKGASSENKKHRGISYEKIIDNKRNIHSIHGYLNNFLIISNSETMFKNIVDTSNKKKLSLADAHDFKNTRNIFPLDLQKEEAFFYTSEALLEKLNSPSYKISRLRRKICMKNLNNLKYAYLHYYNDNEKEPASIAKLTEQNFLFPNITPLCPEKGTYSLNNQEPFCSVHRKLEHLTPIDETLPLKINTEEKEYYQSFLKKFHGYDNIISSSLAIRSKNGVNLDLEAFTPGDHLPFFQDIQDYLLTDSNSKMTEHRLKNTFFSVRLFCKTSEILKNQTVQDYLKHYNFPHLEKLLPSLGNQLSIYLCDSDLSYIPDMHMNTHTDYRAILGAFNKLPFYITLDIKNKQELEENMNILMRHATSYSEQKKHDQIKLVKELYSGQPFYVVKTSLNGQQYKIFFFIHKNFLIISSQRDIVETFLANKISTSEGKIGNLDIFLSPANLKKMRKDIIWEGHDQITNQCLQNLGYLNSCIRFLPQKNIVKNISDIYGYKKISCPLDGKYTQKNYYMMCDVHGTRFSLQQPHSPHTINEDTSVWPDTSINLKIIPEGLTATIELLLSK